MKKFKLDESDHLVDLRNFCMIKVDEFLGKNDVNVIRIFLILNSVNTQIEMKNMLRLYFKKNTKMKYLQK